MPSYSAEYQLRNDDYNVQQLRKKYDIPTKQAPKLLLKGDGDLKGSSVGSKELEFTFVENKKKIFTFLIILIINRLSEMNYDEIRLSN